MKQIPLVQGGNRSETRGPVPVTQRYLPLSSQAAYFLMKMNFYNKMAVKVNTSSSFGLKFRICWNLQADLLAIW